MRHTASQTPPNDRHPSSFECPCGTIVNSPRAWRSPRNNPDLSIRPGQVTFSRASGGRCRTQVQVFVNSVSPGWFSVFRTPLIVGRDFVDADRTTAQPVAIVNRTFAEQCLNGANPVGHVVRQIDMGPGRQTIEWSIIGMAADVVYLSLRSPAPPTLYVPFARGPLGLLSNTRCHRTAWSVFARRQRHHAAALAAWRA